jgi:tetratricopeptide (TPR) repeat protein
MGTVPSRRLMAGAFFLAIIASIGVAQDSSPDETPESLSRLSEKHRDPRQRAEAERLLRRKVTLEEQTFGSRSMQVAQTLDTLADLYSEDANYLEAEAVLRTSLAIHAAIDGPETTTANCLVRLARVVAEQQKFVEAEHLYREVLTRQMRDTGTEDFTILGELAEVYRLAKDYSKAEEINQRALQLEVGSQEPGSGFILGTIERLGTVYEEQGKYVQEETLYRNAAESSQALLPRGDLTIIAHLNDLGLFYERRERFQEAEKFYGRALDQFDGLSNDGLKDLNLGIVTRNYARLLRLMGRVAEAEQYEAKVK